MARFSMEKQRFVDVTPQGLIVSFNSFKLVSVQIRFNLSWINRIFIYNQRVRSCNGLPFFK